MTQATANEAQTHGELFDPATETQAAAAAPVALPQGAARVLRPNRSQLEFRASDLESLLPEAHRARVRACGVGGREIGFKPALRRHQSP